MRSTLDGSRASIKSASTQCFYNLDAAVVNIFFPIDTICTLNFSPVVVLKNEGGTSITSGKFYVQVDGGSTQIIDWTGYLGILDQAQVTLPLQTVAAGSHTITVTFGNANNGTDNFSANDSKTKTFYAYDGGTASGVPFTENFETAFPSANWSIVNSNNDATWTQSSSGGGYAISAYGVVMNNLSFGTNPGKRKDAIVSDVYDISSLAYPELKFDVAYAAYNGSRADSLNVYYSINCGSTWTKIWNQKGSDLATAPNQTTLFLPAFDQWKTVSIPLVSLSGQTKVAFKFENVCGWGNALYLDNINLQNNQALVVSDIERVEVKMFPNPAFDMVGVRLPSSHNFKQISLVNNVGQVLYEAEISESSTIIPLQNFANGIYYLQLKGKNNSQTEKLIIAR